MSNNCLSIPQEVLIALRRIIRSIDTHSRDLIERRGVTVPQLVILQKLMAGPSTLGQLAREVHLSQATVSGIVDRLEQRQFLSRERHTDDRRRVVIELTDAGRQLIQSAPSPLQDRFIKRLNDLQTWEQTQILASLQRIVAMMEAEDVDASPMLATGPLHVNDTPGGEL